MGVAALPPPPPPQARCCCFFLAAPQLDVGPKVAEAGRVATGLPAGLYRGPYGDLAQAHVMFVHFR